MGAIGTVSPHDMPATVEDRRKKKRYAYPAWLCLGSHYLYLDRPFTQLLFWLTLGGLLLWWLTDLFRLPALVEEHNRRETERLISAHEESLQQRLLRLETLHRAGWQPAPPMPAAVGPARTSFEPLAPHVADLDQAQPARTRGRTGPAVALTGALAISVALYVFNPPPLFPHADASFRTLRQVNVRDLPSTASPIRGVVARRTVLSGTVEAAPAGTGEWLKIGRGSHSGGYVAVQNLETL